MNRITNLFGIQYPIIQGGMVWCSGWRLAAAVSNHGGLGLLGAGSMHPDTLTEHIRKMKTATTKPWGVNVPLLYPEIDRLMEILVEEGVKIIFTSAGSPKKWTSYLKAHGMTVVHVVSSALFARKCEEAGCDAIVAGGIASGKAMLAAMMLGAEGVQIGTRFAVATESSAHPAFKQRVFDTPEGGTMLALKKLAPTRLIKNEFYEQVKLLEANGADADSLKELLGKGRAKQGIFEGNLTEGELEIGQVASMLHREESVAEILQDIMTDYRQTLDACRQSDKYAF